MFNQGHNHNTPVGKLRLLTYRTFYENVRNRLCLHEEAIGFDFFSSQHEGGDLFLKYYQDNPTAYRCKLKDIWCGGPSGPENVYLVAAGREKVALLLAPDVALTRNLPFLATLEGNFFQPYHGCPTTYWQTHIEPVLPRPPVENVLQIHTPVLYREFTHHLGGTMYC